MANPTQTLRQAPQAFTAYSPEEIKQLREMARQLMEGGQLKPITGPGGTQYFSPMQGLANVVGSGMGGYQEAKANEMERASKAAFAQQLLGAAQGRSPEAAIGAMANPNATDAHIEALSKLLAPQGNVRLGPEPSVEHPAPAFFGGGNAPAPVQQGPPMPPAQGPMPPPQGQRPGPPPVQQQPSPMLPPGPGNLTGPDRSVTGVSVQNLPPGISPSDAQTLGYLQKIKQQNLAENAAATTTATRQAENAVKSQGTSEIVGNITKNLQSDVGDAIKYIDTNPNSTTGQAANIMANIPGTPAAIARDKIRKVEGAVLQHEIQTIENAEQRRLGPDEVQAIRDRIGLNQSNTYPDLRYNLQQIQTRFSPTGSAIQQHQQPPTNMTPRSGFINPAEASPSSRVGNAFKILNVRPPAQGQ